MSVFGFPPFSLSFPPTRQLSTIIQQLPNKEGEGKQMLPQVGRVKSQSTASFQPFPHVASQDSVTPSEETAIYRLPNTQAHNHTCNWLVSL